MNWFKNLKLRHKIAVIFTIFSILVLPLFNIGINHNIISIILWIYYYLPETIFAEILNFVGVIDSWDWILSPSIIFFVRLIIYYGIWYMIGLVIEKIKKK